MATLTKSTGTVTLSGAAEKVNLPAVYGWVWLKNMSDADMFAGLSADISEGADGVMVIPAGECGRIQTDGFNSIYLVGTGNALVVAQNYADCPFKAGAKGGGNSGLQFNEYGQIIGTLELPEGVTEIPGNYAYISGNAAPPFKEMTGIKFPSSLVTIKVEAFRGLPYLSSVEFKGTNLKTLGDLCFYGCSALRKLILPEGVETIGASLASALIELYLPASITSMPNSALTSCVDLANLTVGEGFNCDLNISKSTKITAETINAIITNYADNSGKTLTLGSTNLAKLSDEDKAVATSKGLTLV